MRYDMTRLTQQDRWYTVVKKSTAKKSNDIESAREIHLYIESSGLPTALIEIAISIVDQVKLNDTKRLIVAKDLVEQFDAGLGGGISEADLITSFSDIKRVAKRLRSTRLQARHDFKWYRKRLILAGICLIALLTVTYFGSVLYYKSGSIVISRDFEAEITAKARAVAEEDRAWPLYREALIVLLPGYDVISDTYSGAIPSWPDIAGWEDMVAFLSENEASLDLIREAASKPGMGYVVGHTPQTEDDALWPVNAFGPLDPNSIWDTSIIGLLLPQLGVTRSMAKIVSSDIGMEAERGNSERVVSGFVAMFGMAKHARETPTLISDLVAASIVGLACRTIEDLLRDQPELFSELQLRELMQHLSSLTGEGVDNVLHIRVETERKMMLDIIQRIYTDDGNGNGHLTAGGYRQLDGHILSTRSIPKGLLLDLAVPFVTAGIADRKEVTDEVNRLMDRAEAESLLPLWKIQVSYESVDDEIDRLSGNMGWSTKYVFIGSLLPAFGRAHANSERITMRRNALLAAIALELYRRDHNGNYPAMLEDLVPVYISSVPVDQFVGTAIGYVVSADHQKATLYSVGADLDDDGGKRPVDDPQNKFDVDTWYGPEPGHEPDGDWIIWESEVRDEEEE